MDLLKPTSQAQFELGDFLKKKTECGLFINFLTDLNKLVAFDQRDAY
jgi:serine/threonine-protein phosphatase 2A regulatory subunit B''